MKYISNKKKMNKFRKVLRENKMLMDWNEERGGMNYDRYKKNCEKKIYKKQISGDKLEDDVVKTFSKVFKNKNYILIRDIIIDFNTHIDLLLLTSNGVFIIEVNDWKGEFQIKNDMWKKKIRNGKTFCYKDNKNPFIKIKKKEKKLRNLFEEKKIEAPLFSYIFLNNDCVETDDNRIVCSKEELVKKINKDINLKLDTYLNGMRILKIN
ncbi:nuclease-related domain-containing protein [Virgibacillus sp. DJP39]|uniref:nuclease-related domain-containing protein n=1 Tax=Virgibacillus sp. DJP39 TaxID=3409790 RepID=UPI003BB76E55